MKSKMRRSLFALVLAGVMVMYSAATAFAADASLTFGGADDQFVFDMSNGTSLIEMDRLLPGDTRVQTVDVRNNNSRSIELHMKTIPAEDLSEEGQELLDLMTLTIKRQFGTEPAAVIYRGPLSGAINSAFEDDPGGMMERIYLGELPSGGTGILEVSVELPTELGNAYQNAVTQVLWQFTAENYDEASSSSSSSSGGDDDGGTDRIDNVYYDGTTILDSDVPTTNAPITTIDENQVPLGSLPKTGSN